jgi:hypothetical protein
MRNIFVCSAISLTKTRFVLEAFSEGSHHPSKDI